MRALSACLICLSLAACDDKPAEPPAKPPSHATATSPGADPVVAPNRPPATVPTAPQGPSEISWNKPDAWETADNPSAMRKATYKVKPVEGDPEPAEMSVTQVGGSVEANIKRWEGQFDGAPAAKTTKSQVNGLDVTVVEIEGTFKGGGPMMGGSGESKSDWALLGAIVHTEPAHFFKMTGPKKTVQAARPDFDVLVGSFAKK